MDLNDALEEGRKLAALIIAGDGDADDAGRLAELFAEMDESLSEGGVLPDAWADSAAASAA